MTNVKVCLEVTYSIPPEILHQIQSDLDNDDMHSMSSLFSEDSQIIRLSGTKTHGLGFGKSGRQLQFAYNNAELADAAAARILEQYPDIKIEKYPDTFTLPEEVDHV